MGARSTFLVLLASLGLVAAAPQGCAHAGKVKVYFSRPDLGGVYRKQENELVKYEETNAYRCVTPEDWQVILNLIQSCQSR